MALTTFTAAAGAVQELAAVLLDAPGLQFRATGELSARPCAHRATRVELLRERRERELVPRFLRAAARLDVGVGHPRVKRLQVCTDLCTGRGAYQATAE